MTTAEKLAKIAENVPKVYEAGVASVKPILLDTHTFTKTPYFEGIDGYMRIDCEGRGVDSYFYNGDGEVVMGAVSCIEADDTYFTIYSDGDWYTETNIDTHYWYDHNGNEITDDRCRVIQFTEEITVSKEEYAVVRSLFECDVNSPVEIGYEAGRKSQYDEFWTTYQQNGMRTNYEYAFAGYGWTDETFKPKYDIRPVGSCTRLFSRSLITDLEAALNECGVVLDTSKATSLNNAFSSNTFTILPAIAVSGCTNDTSYPNLVLGSNVHTLRKLIVGKYFPPPATFETCTGLVNIAIEGAITTISYGPSFYRCKMLSKDSITSIVNALEVTNDGRTPTLTLTLESVDKAFETSEGAMDGSTSAEWLALIATKPNWTISLV